jgi:hypothetical protein
MGKAMGTVLLTTRFLLAETGKAGIMLDSKVKGRTRGRQAEG